MYKALLQNRNNPERSTVSVKACFSELEDLDTWATVGKFCSPRPRCEPLLIRATRTRFPRAFLMFGKKR